MWDDDNNNDNCVELYQFYSLLACKESTNLKVCAIFGYVPSSVS